MPLARWRSFKLNIFSFVFFLGSQPQIWLAAQLNPTSVSSLRISETRLSPSPEQASCTRSKSSFVAVQSVASQVKPISTPAWLLFLYSSQSDLVRAEGLEAVPGGGGQVRLHAGGGEELLVDDRGELGLLERGE